MNRGIERVNHLVLTAGGKGEGSSGGKKRTFEGRAPAELYSSKPVTE